MRNLILNVLLGLTLAGAANACPDLTGTFECVLDDGTVSTIAIGQSVANGVTTFKITETAGQYTETQEFIADNQIYPKEQLGLKDAKIRSWCDGNQVKVHFTAKLLDDSLQKVIGYADLNVEAGLDASGNLQQVNKGSLKMEDGEHDLGNKLTCLRKK